MPSNGPSIWVNEARTVVVFQYADGRMTVALRQDPDAIWGPPILVEPEARVHAR